MTRPDNEPSGVPPARRQAVGPAGATDERLIKQRKLAFAARLRKLMIAKDWTQSDLARHAGINRDPVSTYLSGRSFPTDDKARKIARALGVTVKDLFPDQLDDDVVGSVEEFEMRQDPRNSKKYILRINRSVSLGVAAKIIDLIKEDESEP